MNTVRAVLGLDTHVAGLHDGLIPEVEAAEWFNRLRVQYWTQPHWLNSRSG